VDEDYFIHQRNEPLSALIFGTHQLVSRPGQSLAPMLGWYLLRITEASPSLLATVACVPFACGIAQLFLWRQYSLHGAYLKQIKEKRSGGLAEV
jgi:hypothetical protein